jgi:predicted translin family RNA/ssDNA-binding protein
MPKIKDSDNPRDKQQVAARGETDTPLDAEKRAERDRELLRLLGEVIRMSQAWVAALESGDPFTAEKHEDECIKAMERFEQNHRKVRANGASFERTQGSPEPDAD